MPYIRDSFNSIYKNNSLRCMSPTYNVDILLCLYVTIEYTGKHKKRTDKTQRKNFFK
jgi:hypothetical protein